MTALLTDFDTLSSFACTLADQARLISREHFRRQFDIEAKSDDSPVTVADRNIEERLRVLINESFPKHGILGEEFENEGLDREFVWVLDPIDGTRSFITGMPTFGTLISLLHNQQPILGVIDMPMLDERWVGGSATQTLFNQTTARTSDCSSVKACRLAATQPEMFNQQQLRAFSTIKSQTGFFRYGGDCYNYGLLASGHTDLVIEADLKPFDYFALVPVIRGAGGVITDWNGDELTLTSAGDVVAAATPAIHQQALTSLSST
ncbi:MAG: histidinol-phosphatase [Pseudomonadota bacterium]